MQFERLNGITLHYQTIGDPAEKPLLVFVNSLGTDFRIWRDVVVRLVGRYAIVTYDKRGHGLSGIGDGEGSMDAHVRDLAALLDHLGGRPAIICGLSVGGMIAMGLSAARPDLVRALILSDTAPRIGVAEHWNGRISAIGANGIASIADSILERWFTPGFRSPSNPAFDGYRNMLIRQPAAGYIAACAAIRDTDLTDTARGIGVPTLCVVGDQDGSTPPELVAEMARLIPDARYEVVPDAGHLPGIEQPDRVAAIVDAFVDAFNLRGPVDG
ncbi:MAG TPA: 3-oxoadipate enol-lactonase [Devosiaceae bacterium]